MERSRLFPLAVALVVAVSVAGLTGILVAEEDEERTDPEVKEVDKEVAKKLVAALDDALKTKEPSKIIAAIEPMVTGRHESFVKPLDKLWNHRYRTVREAAARALGSQAPAKKVGPKLAKVLMAKVNQKAPEVAAEAISSMRRLKFVHPKVTKELEGHWRKQKDAPIMRETARYWGDLKLLDEIKLLIAWVEAPQPGNPSSDTNPPASYWEKMWKLWEEIKNQVWDALENMTGQTYRTEKQWRVWLDSPEARKLGIK